MMVVYKGKMSCGRYHIFNLFLFGKKILMQWRELKNISLDWEGCRALLCEKYTFLYVVKECV